jgi:hypothetical protein
MMGIEIRSDAQVVRGLFIHGTGVVIEETAIMEDDVALDHGMTLAGAGKEQGAHHSTIGDHAIIGGGAKGFGKHYPGQKPPYPNLARWGSGICLTRPLLLLAFPAALFFRMAGGSWLIPSWTMIPSPINPDFAAR